MGGEPIGSPPMSPPLQEDVLQRGARETRASHTCFLPKQFLSLRESSDICIHHHLHEFSERDLGYPAELLLCLIALPAEFMELSGANHGGIFGDVWLPVGDTDLPEGGVEEVPHGVSLFARE